MAAKTDYEWTEPKRRAALLIAEDHLTVAEIAEQLEIGDSTIYRWKRELEFQECVQEHVAAIGNRLERYEIAKRSRRVAAKNDRWLRMQRVVEARAEEHKNAPGGATGLLVRTERAIGSGENTRFVEEYAVDTGLLKEMRDIEKEAAAECGQPLASREEITGANGAPLLPDADEVLARLIQREKNGSQQPSGDGSGVAEVPS
jgi:transposase-like protein